MSHLGRFLEAKQPLFDHSLDQLEKRTGKRGVDAHLTAEIAQKAAAAMRELGLEPDCTGPALYTALIDRVKADDARLAKLLGGRDATSLQEMVPLIMKRIGQLDIPRQGWFLKVQVAEQMLQKMPPPAIMKRLGYTDAKALIANEDIFELYTALRFAEDADWLNRFNSQYHKLKPADFQTRNITIVRFSYDKWGDIAEHFVTKKLHNITHSKEMGAIALMPVQSLQTPGVSLKVMPLILHYYNEIRLYSAFFKLIKKRSDFGQVVVDTLIADTPKLSILKGEHIHWRVIQRYFGKLGGEKHPEIFEPHVQPEDLHWRKAESYLVEVDPELEFWHHMDYVGVFKGDEAVTFNLMDVSLSYANELKYGDRYLYHFREALWNEIFARYFTHHVLESQILEKLNNQLIKPEEIRV